jgi:uncharacterized protein (DUF362 family)
VLEGRGFTVSQSSNVFTVTFSQKYAGLVAAFADVAVADPTAANYIGINAHVVTTAATTAAQLWNSSTQVLTIQLLKGDGTAATTVDGDPDGCIVSFMVLFRNTSVS